MSEHQFAARVVRLDVDTIRVPLEPPTGRAWWRRVVDFVRGISGLDAYDRYLEHQRRIGCERVLTEAEFWREEWDRGEREPKARCC